MARPAKLPQHPIRLLRITLGLTRRDFAELIGVSADTIASIENNRLGVSEKFARRVSFVTGANCAELRKGRLGQLKNSGGKIYRASDYRRRRRLFDNLPNDVIALRASELCKQIRNLLSLSAKKNRLAVAYCDIADCHSPVRSAEEVSGERVLRLELAPFHEA